MTIDLAISRLQNWAQGHGEFEITVAPPHPDPDVEMSNLIDSLSAYIHGQYLEWYGRGPRPVLDFEGHPVTRE